MGTSFRWDYARSGRRIKRRLWMGPAQREGEMQNEPTEGQLYINGQLVPCVSEVVFGDEVSFRVATPGTRIAVRLSGGDALTFPNLRKVYTGNARDRRRQKRADRKRVRAQASTGAMTFKRFGNGALRPV